MQNNDWNHDWDRVQSVFLSVADLPPRDQARVLDTACGGDRALRAEVESLLASDHQDAQVIASTIASEAALLFGARTLIGDRLGAYRVVKEIGRGGMGDVYLAVRDDDQFQKQVAIKVVRRGMDTADVLGRFQHERQILANLDHPYIARLLDGGTTFDGRPFFVMDYVEGQPLEQFCEQKQPDMRARCQLFLRILDAVAHAHRNLVVHRDLKPANIFVTSDGSPKLLDFGVAKLLAVGTDPGVTAASPARPFTPEYASPEQVHGLAVTTATDIYSLGAVFYELLTGKRAQPIAPLTPAVVERVVCQTEVPRPSLLAPDLDSDLDNIVLMAMRKEPERRYQSVDQLADDVRRHLDGRPVLARQDSFWYRARKFARRNRFEIAAATLVFASLVVALVVSLAQARDARTARQVAEAQRAIAERERTAAERERERAEAGFKQAELARAGESQQRIAADRERDEAVRQRAQAEQRLTQLFELADKTLFDIHDAVAKLPGATEARRVLVKTTLDYLESIERERGLDDRTRIALGAAYTKVAAVQDDSNRSSLGDFEGARASYLKAEALLAPVLTRRQNDPDTLMRWIEVQGGLAKLSATRIDIRQGVERYLNLLPIAHRLATLAPFDHDALKQEAAIHGQISQELQSLDTAAAREHSSQQIAMMTALVHRFPEDRDYKQELGVALAAEAGALKDAGEFARAAEYFERSIKIREEFLAAEPNNSYVQRNLLVVYGNYATLLGIPWSANIGHYAEARMYCEKSVALARKLAEVDPQDKTARFDLGVSLARLGMVEPDADHVADSRRSLEEALTFVEPIRKANANSTSIANQVALVHEYLGYRLRHLGQLEPAAEQFRQGLDEMDSALNANPGQVVGMATALANEEALAGIYAAQGDRAAALEHAHHAVDRAEKYAAGIPNKATPLGHLGNAYFELAAVERSLGDWDGAAEAAGRAAAIWAKITNTAVLSVHRQARQDLDSLVREIDGHRTQ